MVPLHHGTRAPRPELRDRVLQAAASLGYSSNGPAQALARATTPVVGLIVHDVTDPYFAALAIGAMRVAHEHGLLVLVGNTFRDPALEFDYLARLRAQRARGVLLLPVASATSATRTTWAANWPPYRPWAAGSPASATTASTPTRSCPSTATARARSPSTSSPSVTTGSA